MFLIAAAILAASPTTMSAAMSSAQPGDTIKLAAGDYQLVRIQRRSWTPPVEFDATVATLGGGVTVENSTGVTWRGGTFVGAEVDGYGTRTAFNVSRSTKIVLENASLRRSRNGVTVGYSSDVRIANNAIRGMSADGIDVFMSRNVVVDRNSCAAFVTSPGAHADCIQLWSRPDAQPTADVRVTNNQINGDMQGIFLGDGIRAGVADGGFDRIMVEGNTVLTTFGSGIALYNCRGCSVRQNSVNSLPNYRNKAQLYVNPASVVVACGNTVPMVPKQATPPCAN